MFALIDCDNFYASCERVFQPDLIDKPIVVLSNNDGCVIALSNEAKSLGINVSRSAEAGIAEAVRLHKQKKWLNENVEALESSSAYVETNGLPLARHRQF